MEEAGGEKKGAKTREGKKEEKEGRRDAEDERRKWARGTWYGGSNRNAPFFRRCQRGALFLVECATLDGISRISFAGTPAA